MSEQVDCGILIVTYNSANDIKGLLASIPAAAAGLRLRTVVVDNGSVDDTVGIVRTDTSVICVETGANLGYAGAINVGRPLVKPCSSLVILNPDLRLEENAIATLFDGLADSSVGITVPMLLAENGTLSLSLRREPSLTRALGDAILGRHLPHRSAWLSEMVRDERRYGERHSVDWATGAAMAVSARCDQAVGDWDECFFLYSEETDFAFRARQAGFRIEYVPEARAHHRGGGSGESPALVALMAVNRVRYFEKHHRGMKIGLFRLAVGLHELLRVGNCNHRKALSQLMRRSAWLDRPDG